jgi:hypothetical protein
MSKINYYTTAIPTTTDLLLGTDVSGTPNDATKNFTAGSVAALVQSAGVLTLPPYRDNAAAVAGGLTAGALYQTDGTGPSAPLDTAGIVMVVQ